MKILIYLMLSITTSIFAGDDFGYTGMDKANRIKAIDILNFSKHKPTIRKMHEILGKPASFVEFGKFGMVYIYKGHSSSLYLIVPELKDNNPFQNTVNEIKIKKVWLLLDGHNINESITLWESQELKK